MKEWDTQPRGPWQELAALAIARFDGLGYVIGAVVETHERAWLPPRGTLTLQGSMGSQYVEQIDVRLYIDRRTPYGPCAERRTVAWEKANGLGTRGSPLERVGSASAVYYPRDRSITIWGCALYERYRTGRGATEDQNLSSLWRGLEGYLWARFPHAKQLVVPNSLDSGAYPPEEWKAFLSDQGYSLNNMKCYRKMRASQ